MNKKIDIRRKSLGILLDFNNPVKYISICDFIKDKMLGNYEIVTASNDNNDYIVITFINYIRFSDLLGEYKGLLYLLDITNKSEIISSFKIHGILQLIPSIVKLDNDNNVLLNSGGYDWIRVCNITPDMFADFLSIDSAYNGYVDNLFICLSYGIFSENSSFENYLLTEYREYWGWRISFSKTI